MFLLLTVFIDLAAASEGSLAVRFLARFSLNKLASAAKSGSLAISSRLIDSRRRQLGCCVEVVGTLTGIVSRVMSSI